MLNIIVMTVITVVCATLGLVVRRCNRKLVRTRFTDAYRNQLVAAVTRKYDDEFRTM